MHLKLMFVRLCEIFHELFCACRKTINKTSLFTCATWVFRDPSFFSFFHMYFSIFIFSVYDSKGVTYLFMWRCLSRNQENRIPIAFGNENIAKWDDFPMKVEFANDIMTSDWGIHFQLLSLWFGKTIFVKL